MSGQRSMEHAREQRSAGGSWGAIAGGARKATSGGSARAAVLAAVLAILLAAGLGPADLVTDPEATLRATYGGALLLQGGGPTPAAVEGDAAPVQPCVPACGDGGGGKGGPGHGGSGHGGHGGPSIAPAGGPSGGLSADVARGVVDDQPGPDLVVHNPFGMPVAFRRRSSSAIPSAYADYASPGLPAGWTDDFDHQVVVNGTGTTFFTYPNGAFEIWTPTMNMGAVTFAGSGLQYVAKGTYTTPGTWTSATVTWKDGTQWVLKQKAGTANTTLTLDEIVPPEGEPIFLNRGTTDPFPVNTVSTCPGSVAASACDSAAKATVMLLTFARDTSSPFTLRSVTDAVDPAHPTVSYTRAPDMMGVVTDHVSQVNSANDRSAYQYSTPTSSGHSFLSKIMAPDPSQPGTTNTSKTTINYNPDLRPEVARMIVMRSLLRHDRVSHHPYPTRKIESPRTTYPALARGASEPRGDDAAASIEAARGQGGRHG